MGAVVCVCDEEKARNTHTHTRARSFVRRALIQILDDRSQLQPCLFVLPAVARARVCVCADNNNIIRNNTTAAAASAATHSFFLISEATEDGWSTGRELNCNKKKITISPSLGLDWTWREKSGGKRNFSPPPIFQSSLPL